MVQIQSCYFSNLKTSRDFDIRFKFTNCSPDYKKTSTCQNKSSAEQHVSSCQSTILFLDMEMVRDLCIYIYIYTTVKYDSMILLFTGNARVYKNTENILPEIRDQQCIFQDSEVQSNIFHLQAFPVWTSLQASQVQGVTSYL